MRLKFQSTLKGRGIFHRLASVSSWCTQSYCIVNNVSAVHYSHVKMNYTRPTLHYQLNLTGLVKLLFIMQVQLDLLWWSLTLIVASWN